MAATLEDLKTYLAEHPQKYPLGEFDCLLESLFWEYLDRNYVSTDIIRIQSLQAEDQMELLTEAQKDEVFNNFHLMCGELQRLAFAAGAQVGARLTLELMDSKK